MIYQIIAYIKFLVRSTNQHGVHSPFVFNFVTRCLYDAKNYDAYGSIYAYRKALLASNEEFEVTDFGSGSRVFKSQKRLVKKIVKHSGTSLKRSKLFYRLISYFHPETVLELGTSLGIVAHAMACANTQTKIISIEGCPNVASIAKKQLKKFNIENADVQVGTFKDRIPKLNQNTFDLVFFDGHHDKQATIDYFNLLLPKANNESVFVFDDIYWSKGMTDAWEHIKIHENVTVSIDCFHLGFVFFRKEQTKEHFKIRL
ncbi:O-methyltransferase [Winogradskyella aurantia]|uniref:Methyltransferase n=1 Tax=Winogradskyella aurantia TaxID=1915063 RepID=A0A265UQJ4_9FLAO|nr:class I SAM-dependent methyltransferase [Winogradskyella aurantia]OZV67569.1 methyltransferase [Winogradskyella aurantia]